MSSGRRPELFYTHLRKMVLYETDEYLRPYAASIEHWHALYIRRLEEIKTEHGSLEDFASAYKYYGLHCHNELWTLREYAPHATKIYVLCDANDWHDDEAFAMQRLVNGNWELTFPVGSIAHGRKYKMHVYWQGGDGMRLPAYANRVVQDTSSLLFDAQAWQPDVPFAWTDQGFVAPAAPLLIYEAHIGMSGENAGIASYDDFRRNVLPHVKKMGYNVLQLMAIQEHPYYGSFGYHVSNFFAASSRFGTPEELKELINEAHANGIAVIMDIVHSHAVKNENEGISRQDGTTDLYFHYGERGNHPAWDSRCFDYAKPAALQFLLSNQAFWLQEYHFDGFRFDGVTSMLYLNHGLEQNYTCYNDYFTGNEDDDAVAFLTLSNHLIHKLKPSAITIAEEMSGFPGIAGKIDDLGVGFDYRLSMGVPDYWIKLIKEVPDEQWPVGKLFYELQQHRAEELTINYAESHDQALVGDKTIIFRLMDSEMYTKMNLESQSMVIDRGMALHKMIRLITLFTSCGGYLTFMGNEFGHPEWIDFPREGNLWSYKYARRQWSLARAPYLRYHFLLDFEQEMLRVFNDINATYPHHLYDYDPTQVVAFMRGDYLLVFNFNPTESYTDYAIPAPRGRYNIVLSTDEARFGGFDRNDMFFVFYTQPDDNTDRLHLYLPSRSAMVLHRRDIVRIR